LFVPLAKRFPPRKFLKLATRLIADRKYEEPSRIRTAVGRAYYAAFLYTKERLQRLGYHFPDDYRVHRAVIDKLMDRGDTTIGSQLDTLFEKRRTADYYMDTPLHMHDGNYSLALSQRVIDSADLLRR